MRNSDWEWAGSRVPCPARPAASPADGAGVWRVGFLCGLLLAGAAARMAAAEQTPAEPGSEFLDMSIEELMEVEISVASKKAEALSAAPGVVGMVPREEFEVYGDRNLHQLLQRQPSVYTLHSFAFADNLAAFRGDLSTHQERHTLILFNGRPVRESALGYHFPLYLAFPLSALSSVELIRGPGSVLYGTNAFTGVVDLRSRAIPDRDEFSISALGGSYGSYDTTASFGGRSGGLGGVLDVRAVGQQGWPYRLTDQAGVSDEQRSHDQSFAAATHLDYRGLTFDLFAADVEIFTMGAVPLWSNVYDESRVRRLFTNLGYGIPLHERLRLELNVTHNLQEDVQAVFGSRRVGTNTSDVLGEATLFASPWDNVNLLFGGLQEYRSNYQPDDEYFQSIRPYHYHPRSLYAQGDYQVLRFLKLIAGTQWNQSPLGDSDFASRFGVILTPHQTWGVKLLRGEAFRGPMAVESDLYDPGVFTFAGNPDLKPETIETYDAQLFYHGKTTHAALTYFHSEARDLIVYDVQRAIISYKNGGAQQFEGIELEARHFLTPHWHVLGSFLHQENEVDAGLQPSDVPADMVKLGTAYTWDGGSASLFWAHFGTPPRRPGATNRNPEPEAANLVSATVRLDLSRWLSWPQGRATLILRAENLLDQDLYVPTFTADSFPSGPGRTLYAGATLRFP